MNWSESSLLVLGLVLDGRVLVNSVRPELFIEPYDKCIKLLQKTPDMPIEELTLKTNLTTITNAFEAVHRMNGLGEKDWVKVLEQSATLYDAGTKMERIGKKLMQGESKDDDLLKLKGLLVDIEQDSVADFVTAADVGEDNNPFVLSGWDLFDKHMGGLPEAGMVVLGGLPGAGKTMMCGRFLYSFLKKHKDKKVLLFSLEMMATEVIPRIKGMLKAIGTQTDDELWKRLVVCDKPLNVSEIIGRACKIDNLGLVIVDFIDWAIEGEVTELAMTLAYNQFAKAAKSLHIPIIVVAQFNDLKGMPKPRNIRWTRMAWALCWQMLMIYDPSINWSNDMSDEDKQLPISDGYGYLLCWKSRGGFRNHLDDSPGAIQIRYDGTHGWSNSNGSWFTLKKAS